MDIGLFEIRRIIWRPDFSIYGQKTTKHKAANLN